MKYREMTIETTEAGIEAVTACLMTAGIDNIEVADPADIIEIMAQKNSYTWDYIEEAAAEARKDVPRIRLYFAEDEEGRALEKAARQALADLKKQAQAGAFGEGVDFGPLDPVVCDRDDAEWKDKWKEGFRPQRISERLVVRPSWEEYQAAPGDVVIEIDPGMAFGTGTHETTSLCLEMIDEKLVPGSRFLDMGCGSGILSIAAALLGAGEVLAVDIDPEAVRVTQENAEKNGVTIRCEEGNVAEGVDFQADLIAANLMAELLCMLAEGAAAHLAPGGLFISSGILTEKEDMVRAAYEKAGLTILEIREKGEWCAVLAARAGEAQA